MREIVLRPDAEADIEDAASYTIDQWGHEQAQVYIGELRRAIELLAATVLHHPLFDKVYPVCAASAVACTISIFWLPTTWSRC